MLADSVSGENPLPASQMAVCLLCAHMAKKWKYGLFWTSLVTQTVKCLPTMWETLGSIPGSGRSPGEGICNCETLPIGIITKSGF